MELVPDYVFISDVLNIGQRPLGVVLFHLVVLFKTVRLHKLGNLGTGLPAAVEYLVHAQVNVRILKDFLKLGVDVLHKGEGFIAHRIENLSCRVIGVVRLTKLAILVARCQKVRIGPRHCVRVSGSVHFGDYTDAPHSRVLNHLLNVRRRVHMFGSVSALLVNRRILLGNKGKGLVVGRFLVNIGILLGYNIDSSGSVIQIFSINKKFG